MKRKIVILLFLCVFLAVSAFSLDLGFFYDMGNLAIPRDTEEDETSFAGDSFPWGFSIYGKQMAGDNIGVDVSFNIDPVLRNISYTLFEYKADFFSIGVGPFFGFFNTTDTILKSGISTSFKAEIPGAAFVSFRADSSIGGGLESIGDYTQERNDVSIGYYVYNAICSLNLLTKRYAEIDETQGSVIDDFTEYSFKTTIFKKNVPYRIMLNFAYQQREKTFVDSTITYAVSVAPTL